MVLWPKIVEIINEAIAAAAEKKTGDVGFMSFSNVKITGALLSADATLIKHAADVSTNTGSSGLANSTAQIADPSATLKKANQSSETSPTANNKPAEAAQGCPVKESEKPPCKCAKKHVDLRGTVVQWQTQFDSRWGDRAAQNVACWKTSHDILINSGLSESSGSQDGMYQVAEENEDHSELLVNAESAMQSIGYIDGQLESNYPVLVGVDHDLNYRGGTLNEGTTDHYIVIVGKACDDGNIYYLFYDVGTSFGDKGASDSNQLFLDTSDYSLKGSTEYNGKLYTVTQVRLNYPS